jgi:SAM-dependent methyltransferase
LNYTERKRENIPNHFLNMSQNIYDTPNFFTTYSQLPRSVHGLQGAPEWPTLRSLIGSAQSKRILDLGCGFGWFCRWARDEGGAEFVKGLDLSENMIAKARDFEKESGKGKGVIEYGIADLETLRLGGKAEWDVVFSSLTFHYLKDWRRIVGEVHGALVQGGRFVFSVEHPIYTAPISTNPEFRDVSSEEQGEETTEPSKVWPLTSYAVEGERKRTWLNADGVRKYHRTIETYLTVLMEEGFAIRAVKEWMPSAETIKEKPGWVGERDRPMFLLIGVVKE